MVDKKKTEAAREFARGFSESLAGSIFQSLGVQWRFTVLETQNSAEHREQPIHFRLELNGGLRGQCVVQFSESQIVAMVSKRPGQPDAAFTEEHSDAMTKLISSAMSGVSASLAGNYGELTVAVDLVDYLASDEMLSVSLAVTEGAAPGTPVTLHFDSELLAALARESPATDAAKAEDLKIDPVNLKLVMDVELNVSLRFGQRQMPLRDVLDLASGSIVELDRQVDEPVELLLDGKVIARGEAVIVDGNYGLRVTEIPQPIASYLIH